MPSGKANLAIMVVTLFGHQEVGQNFFFTQGLFYPGVIFSLGGEWWYATLS